MSSKYTEILNRYNNRCVIDADIAKYHTFRIHGKADMVLLPENKEEFLDMLRICKQQQYTYAVIGNGSNILFNNGVYNGVLISTKKMKNISIQGTSIFCECGVPLPSVAMKALKSNLKGLEKLSGIPGTMGGVIVMNAGAHGSEIRDVLRSVCVCDENGNVYELTPDELNMSYRHSSVKEKNLIVLSCQLILEHGNYDEIKEVMESCKQKRINSQPLEFPSAGSVFKKEGEFFAGKLIDDLGLKGFSIGGATVSVKHANFIVNTDNATTLDIQNLIAYIQKEVYKKYNVNLHTEIEFL